MFTKKPVRNGAKSRPTTHDEFVRTFTEAAGESDSDKPDRKGPSSGYMAELEFWLNESVYEPIKAAIVSRDSKELHIAFNEATVQIKRKVLASYHNGLKARKNG